MSRIYLFLELSFLLYSVEYNIFYKPLFPKKFMNPQERKYLIIGITLTLLVILIIIGTFHFSEYLIKYSGITTFYSLVAIFLIFSLTEYFRRKEAVDENTNLLRSILRVSKSIEKDVDYYVSTLKGGGVPPTTLYSFDLDGLPLEIKSISTKKLDELISFANSKIDVINEWKSEYLNILIDPDGEKREKREKRLLEVWTDNINNSVEDLKTSLENIKSELAKWIRTEL